MFECTACKTDQTEVVDCVCFHCGHSNPTWEGDTPGRPVDSELTRVKHEFERDFMAQGSVADPATQKGCECPNKLDDKRGELRQAVSKMTIEEKQAELDKLRTTMETMSRVEFCDALSGVLERFKKPFHPGP